MNIINFFTQDRLYPFKSGPVVNGLLSVIPVTNVHLIIYSVTTAMIKNTVGNIPESERSVIRQFRNERNLKTVIPIIIRDCIIAPITEEIIFRYFLQGRNQHECESVARKRVIISSIIFGLGHLDPEIDTRSNIHVMIITSMAGVGFSLITKITGNLWASTFSHMLWNLFPIIF
jgi:membrane protease YdiL (CAAX protease family)